MCECGGVRWRGCVGGVSLYVCRGSVCVCRGSLWVVTGMCLCVSQTCAQETHSPSHVTWLYYGGARGVIIGSTTVVCV